MNLCPRTIGLLIFLGCSGSLLQSHQCETGFLDVKVSNEAEMNQHGALVRIEHWTIPTGYVRSELQSQQAKYVENTGVYSAQLEPGVYDIFVSGYGLLPFCQRVEIKTGTRVVVNARLKFGPETHLVY